MIRASSVAIIRDRSASRVAFAAAFAALLAAAAAGDGANDGANGGASAGPPEAGMIRASSAAISRESVASRAAFAAILAAAFAAAAAASAAGLAAAASASALRSSGVLRVIAAAGLSTIELGEMAPVKIADRSARWAATAGSVSAWSLLASSASMRSATSNWVAFSFSVSPDIA